MQNEQRCMYIPIQKKKKGETFPPSSAYLTIHVDNPESVLPSSSVQPHGAEVRVRYHPNASAHRRYARLPVELQSRISPNKRHRRPGFRAAAVSWRSRNAAAISCPLFKNSHHARSVYRPLIVLPPL